MDQDKIESMERCLLGIDWSPEMTSGTSVPIVRGTNGLKSRSLNLSLTVVWKESLKDELN